MNSEFHGGNRMYRYAKVVHFAVSFLSLAALFCLAELALGARSALDRAAETTEWYLSAFRREKHKLEEA